MEPLVYACTSHKGGTGRSVATANIAYRLSLENELSVCVVDLDVDSPTFASVLNLPQFSTGAEIGIRSFLAEDDDDRIPVDTFVNGDGILRNVGKLAQESLYTPDEFQSAGEFALVPGSKSRDIEIPKLFGQRLKQLIERLSSSFDVILIDVAAGESDALLSIGESKDKAGGQLDGWLLFCRWTPQHIAAAGDLRDRMLKMTPDVPVKVIRTAVPVIPKHPWFDEQHKRLKDQFSRVFKDSDTDLSIPFEPVFQWREGVLTERSRYEHGEQVTDTIDAFSEIASFLVESS